MMIKVPGKIFISGEYAALKGMPALTVAVNPGFEFKKSNTAAFHEESPAGKFNPSLLGFLEDPYKGIGGLGKSTAEFLVAAGFGASPWEIWQKYRNLFSDQMNIPSGVDLITQLTGGYCLTETSKQVVEKFEWPFANLDWLALVTGNKVKTHEHLQGELKLDWTQLEALNAKVTESFKNKYAEEFIKSLTSWREFLLTSGLETSASTELIDLFLDMPGVQTAKGCGALGSDVIFIVFEKGSREVLEKSLEFWNPQHIIRSHQVNFEGAQKLESHESISTL